MLNPEPELYKKETSFIERYKKRVHDWAYRNASSRFGTFWLSLISFTESFISPLPPDIVLFGILVLKRGKKWFYYVAVTTISSVAGAVIGYIIGSEFMDLFGAHIIELYNLQAGFDKVQLLYNQYSAATIFIAAFTPIPYKVFTISAGIADIPMTVLIFVSILGRGLRFFIVGYLMHRFGKGIASLIYKKMNIFLWAILGLFILLLTLIILL